MNMIKDKDGSFFEYFKHFKLIKIFYKLSTFTHWSELVKTLISSSVYILNSYRANRKIFKISCFTCVMCQKFISYKYKYSDIVQRGEEINMGTRINT